MKALAATIIGALALSACAAPATRISTSLRRYGLDEQRSDCVGTQLQSGLSLGQLQQLARAAKAYRTNDTTPGVLTTSDLVRVASELKDPEIALVLGKATLACGVTH